MDSWILVAPSTIEYFGEHMSFSPAELYYQPIQSMSKSSSSLVKAYGPTNSSTTTPSTNILYIVFPYDKAIMEIMTLAKYPWC